MRVVTRSIMLRYETGFTRSEAAAVGKSKVYASARPISQLSGQGETDAKTLLYFFSCFCVRTASLFDDKVIF